MKPTAVMAPTADNLLAHDPVIADALARILEVSEPERVIVFGSRARGDAGPDSDLDLLVVLREVDDPRAEAISFRRVLSGLPVPKDVYVVTPEQLERRRRSGWHIVGRALRDGREIYSGHADA